LEINAPKPGEGEHESEGKICNAGQPTNMSRKII
jgi:hypothetical protein